MKNYYKSELAQLVPSEFDATIQIRDGEGNKTKNLNINLESIPVIIEFLQSEEKRLRENMFRKAAKEVETELKSKDFSKVLKGG